MQNTMLDTAVSQLLQEENDLIEEAKRNVEWCKNSLITNKYRLEKAVHLIQGALEDFDVKRHELDDMLDKLTQKEVPRRDDLNGLAQREAQQ